MALDSLLSSGQLGIMEAENNENARPYASNLRPPSRLPAISSRTLHEISEADTNSRAAPSIPVSNAGQKHKLTGFQHEPPPKRKTLAERAGEPGSSLAAPPNSRPVNSSVRATTLAGVRNGSMSSSISSRTASSRNTSTSTFASSVGHIARVPSKTQNGRPQSAMSHIKSIFKAQDINNRPVTAIGDHSEAHNHPVAGQRQCMPPVSHTPVERGYQFLQFRKQRRRQENQTDNIYNSRSNASTPASNLPVERLAHPNPFRDISLMSGMKHLSLQSVPHSTAEIKAHTGTEEKCPDTPSYIPKPVTPRTRPSQLHHDTSIRKSVKKSPSPRKPVANQPFLTKFSNTVSAWDHNSRLEKMDDHMKQMLSTFIETTSADKTERQEALNIYKSRSTSETHRELQPILATSNLSSPKNSKLTYELIPAVYELETIRTQLSTTNSSLQTEVEDLKRKVFDAGIALDEARRKHDIALEDQQRLHRTEMESLSNENRKLSENEKKSTEDEINRLLKAHEQDIELLEKRLTNELEEEKTKRQQEAQRFAEQLESHRQQAESVLGDRDRETQDIKSSLATMNTDLDREKVMNESLKSKLMEASSNVVVLESSMQAMKAKINFLESDSQAQTQSFVDLRERMQAAIESAAEANSKLRKEETLRRKLHNQVQELKGNIRVFCRVRPTLPAEESDAAKISFPDDHDDSKEVTVMGPEQKSALGNVTTATNSFAYDRVFGPSSQNTEIFDEISQLVQSALDGYNVCIFCYGQTGSGKTFTMSAEDGMIPLAVHQIYDTAKSLEEKGWSYKMEGSFVEVYNEVVNDLLGKAEEIDKKKHEIRHDSQAGKTTITDVNTILLDSPDVVKSILKRATANRSVAATKANERSSRSHSVFILKLIGENAITGERSEGTLNLVDLAGSERIAHSGATGERLKETQNINKSLSCLGDVIAALGQGKEGGHIPYRNSKLTYLLQHSLGGNSKTLMFVMISPLQAHLSETLTSLKFATKVHNTHIGTAKRQAKVRD